MVQIWDTGVRPRVPISWDAGAAPCVPRYFALYSDGLTPTQPRKHVQNLLSSAKPLAKQISFIVRPVFFSRYFAWLRRVFIRYS